MIEKGDVALVLVYERPHGRDRVKALVNGLGSITEISEDGGEMPKRGDVVVVWDFSPLFRGREKGVEMLELLDGLLKLRKKLELTIVVATDYLKAGSYPEWFLREVNKFVILPAFEDRGAHFFRKEGSA